MEEKQLDEINQKLDRLLSFTNEIGRLAVMVEKHERVLRGGNGEELGLSARVANLEKIAEVNHALLFGDEERIGLKGRVQEMANTLAGYNKFMWIVLAAAIGSLLAVWVR
jgi:DNA polymerase III delta prime subunit